MANNDLVTPRSPKCPLMAKMVIGRIVGQANIVVPDCLRDGCGCWSEVLLRCGLKANTFTLEQTRRLDSQEQQIEILEQRIAKACSAMSEHTHG